MGISLHADVISMETKMAIIVEVSSIYAAYWSPLKMLPLIILYYCVYILLIMATKCRHKLLETVEGLFMP